MPKENGAPVVVVDLGGTKINVALIDADYNVLRRERHPTNASKGPQAVIEAIFFAIDQLLEHHGVGVKSLDSISMAPAGFIDMGSGTVRGSPNLPGWSNVPLRDLLRARYDIGTYLIDDARAAALGEHRLGAGKGVADMVLLTVGTGIGGGIIIRNRLYFGALGAAGEIGHMTIDLNGPECPCGNRGCLEMLASGMAIAREARRRVAGGEFSSLKEKGKRDVTAITAENVAEAARTGDRLSNEVIEWAGANLGVGLVNLVNIFNPEMIVIGGGVTEGMGELLLAPARKVVQERAVPISAQYVKIVPATLGNDAGIFGASVFAREPGEWK